MESPIKGTVWVCILSTALIAAVALHAETYPGDCDEDWLVSIGEVQRSINMFLDAESPACGTDGDGDGSVSVGEVQRVINIFLGEAPEAEMVGLDTDGDGIADIIDTDGDGTTEPAFEADCAVSEPYGLALVSRYGGGQPVYAGADLPAGMTLHPSGAITYAPSCADAGLTVAPSFSVNSSASGLLIPFSIVETNRPKVIGFDHDGDGLADVSDADGDWILDETTIVDCDLPEPFRTHLLAEQAADPPEFAGSNLPDGMTVSPDGLLVYDPPCSDFGQAFTPVFTVDGGAGTSAPFQVVMEPRIALDVDGDGIADVEDRDGDGVFDYEARVPCDAQEPVVIRLMGINAGLYPTFTASGLEWWMHLVEDDRLELQPLCGATEGRVYLPTFTVHAVGRGRSAETVLPVPVYREWHDFSGSDPWYVCPAEEVPAEATVVRAFDQAYHYFGAENRRTILQEVDFPEEGSWSQVGLYLHLECPESGLCDHWDRLGSVQLVLNPGDQQEDWQYLELTRHITPYRIEMCEYIDVTPLAHLLRGHQTLQSHIDTWVGPGHAQGEGWRITVDFIFYPGYEMPADEVINIWGRRNVTVGILDPPNDIDSQIEPVTVHIPEDAWKVEARLITTGHSFGNTYNCAEFCAMRQDLYINGTRYSVIPWRDDCEYNPHSPQNGTWTYDRNGWCPGAIVVGDILDVTDNLVMGGDNVVDFDIRLENGEEYENLDPVDWLPNEAVSLQLYIYR